MQQTFETSDPASKDLLDRQIQSALANRDLTRATNLARQLIQRYPQSPGAHCALGVLLMLPRNFPAAEVEFRKTISLQSKFTLAYLFLAGVQAAQHHWADEVATFQKFSAFQPNNLWPSP